jgi:uncharacterized membrane protein YoaK (UPF0700 family)
MPMQLRDLGRTALLCVIAGSADAIAFLRYNTFVGAMTGNTILLGIDLASWRLDRAAFHFSIIAVFLAAVIATRFALKIRCPAGVPLLLAAIMLGGSELIASEWSATICAAALAMQNATVRIIGGVSVNTVFITGDLVTLGAAVPEAADPRRQTTIAVMSTAWIAYAAGAIIGAVALHAIGHPMIVPAVLALVAAGVELTQPRSRA